MNQAQEIRPILRENLVDDASHVVDLLFRELERVTNNWNHRGELSDYDAVNPLVGGSVLARDAKHVLLELGYNNLAYQCEHLGNLCAWAITNPKKRTSIGGSLNRNISQIKDNPHWYVRPPVDEESDESYEGRDCPHFDMG